MKNVLEYLEKSQSFYPDKIAFEQENSNISYCKFTLNCKAIGSFIAERNTFQKPIAILLDKSYECLECAFGVVYSGNFYTILDNKMPAERIDKIIAQLNPIAIITDENNLDKANSLNYNGEIILYETAVKSYVNIEKLQKIRKRQTDSDVLYILFTSGSTGIPKGVVITHRAVIAYTSWVSKEFNFNSSTVFGSQTPFYFSMSVTDIFSTIKAGAKLVIIPKSLFSFPVELIKYLNDREINTLYWVPSALSIVANWKTFDAIKPLHLQRVLFAGEVMPTKQLNYWIKNLDKSITYANLFGPTETTDICTFYVVDRAFDDNESIPIGNACDNCDVIIIDENGKQSNEGELYVRGSFLANGYYGNPEKTSEVFVQNPIQKFFPETVYKTGDLVRLNNKNEIEYISRKDFQIKHMGYRIELGEIENNLNSIESIKNCACIYDKPEDKIIFVYEGKGKSHQDLIDKANSSLPAYMRPNVYVKVRTMPVNANGKTDRKFLTNNYKNI